MDFVDFKWISWISNGFRGFQMDFVDFKWISGFPVDFSRFLDFRLDFCDVVRDFARVGPLDPLPTLNASATRSPPPSSQRESLTRWSRVARAVTSTAALHSTVDSSTVQI